MTELVQRVQVSCPSFAGATDCYCVVCRRCITAIGFGRRLSRDPDMMHAEANESGVASRLSRVGKPDGAARACFIPPSSRRHEIRSITRPRINYELNVREKQRSAVRSRLRQISRAIISTRCTELRPFCTRRLRKSESARILETLFLVKIPPDRVSRRVRLHPRSL